VGSRSKAFTKGYASCGVPFKAKPLILTSDDRDELSFAERWVRSVKQECLSKPMPLSEAYRALSAERNHQGKYNLLLFPALPDRSSPANGFSASSVSAACSILRPSGMIALNRTGPIVVRKAVR
jgi:hypothetical protein